MIKNILLDSNTVFDQYYIDGSTDKILEVKQINLFVGANNSGKSRLLREILDLKGLSFEEQE